MKVFDNNVVVIIVKLIAFVTLPLSFVLFHKGRVVEQLLLFKLKKDLLLQGIEHIIMGKKGNQEGTFISRRSSNWG